MFGRKKTATNDKSGQGSKKGGLTLRLLTTLLYLGAFCCAIIITGIYGYFLAVLADWDLGIPTWTSVVTGLAGAVALYTLFAVLLTCFLGGHRLFALLGILLDWLSIGAFIAIAVLTRDGASRCRGLVQTPLGDGPADSLDLGYGREGFGFDDNENVTYRPSLGRACSLNRVCFAVAIIGALLLLLAMIMQILLSRHHRKNKVAAAHVDHHDHSNGYGTEKRKFWQRGAAPARDVEVANTTLVPATAHTTVLGTETAGTTGYTGSTVAPQTVPYNKYDNSTVVPSVHGGYYVEPNGATPANRGTATNY